jgi:hypothetical protein
MAFYQRFRSKVELVPLGFGVVWTLVWATIFVWLVLLIFGFR